MATATQVALNVKGVDKTGGVFRSVASKAKSAVGGIAVAGAAVAGGMVAAAAAVAMTAKALGKLSDEAQAAGTSAQDLTQISSALDALGIKAASTEEIVKAFQYMTRKNGEVGYDGFKKTIQGLAEIDDAAVRSKTAMETFGRSGLAFMPIIEAVRRNGVDAFDTLKNAMPSVSDAAANAGDAIADSMGFVTTQIKNSWMEVVGAISQALDAQFAGGAREAGLKAVAYIKYFTEYSIGAFRHFGEAWGKTSEGIGEGLWQSVKNAMGLIGRFVWSIVETISAPLRRVFQGLVDQATLAFLKIKDFVTGDNAAEYFAQSLEEQPTTLTDMMKEPWKNLAEYARGLQWFPDGDAFDTTDIEEKLKERLKAATDAAKAYNDAAVNTGLGIGENAAGDLAKAAAAAKNTLIMGGSYKSVTMGQNRDTPMKAADKIVGAIVPVLKKIVKVEEDAEDFAAI